MWVDLACSSHPCQWKGLAGNCGEWSSWAIQTTLESCGIVLQFHFWSFFSSLILIFLVGCLTLLFWGLETFYDWWDGGCIFRHHPLECLALQAWLLQLSLSLLFRSPLALSKSPSFLRTFPRGPWLVEYVRLLASHNLTAVTLCSSCKEAVTTCGTQLIQLTWSRLMSQRYHEGKMVPVSSVALWHHSPSRQ